MLNEIKFTAEAKIRALRHELSDLKNLSLRLPIAFRVLDLQEYELELMRLDGVEHWGDADVKDRLTKAKLKILTKIYTEINSYRSLFNKLGIKIQNTIYRFKFFAS